MPAIRTQHNHVLILRMPRKHRLPLIRNQNRPAPSMAQPYIPQHRMQFVDSLLQLSQQFRGLPAGQYVVSTLGTGGDAQTVEVRSGQIASTTLRNRGVATVKGHVFDWRTGAPVATMRCEIGIRANSGAPSWDASNVAVSDADGRFTLEIRVRATKHEPTGCASSLGRRAQ